MSIHTREHAVSHHHLHPLSLCIFRYDNESYTPRAFAEYKHLMLRLLRVKLFRKRCVSAALDRNGLLVSKLEDSFSAASTEKAYNLYLTHFSDYPLKMCGSAVAFSLSPLTE